MEIRSARNPQHLIVNVSIQIPLKTKCPYRSHEQSLSPSPNHKKKYKLVPTPNQQKKTAHTSNLNTLRDLPYHTEGHPSRKKQTAPTPNISSRGGPVKMKSAQLSPRSKMSSRKSKQTHIIRNISILQKVTSEQDNIIKYTTASNELKEKIQNMRLNLSNLKMDTHMSEVDIVEIRNIETQVREGRDSQHTIRMKDILRTACAKKIQRAWRNHLTRKLIKSYSNDIRKKDLKRAETFDQMNLRTARSQGGGLKLKMRNNIEGEKNGEGLTVKTARDHVVKKNTIIQKFQEQSIEKWEQMLSRIRNQKNIDKLLEISLERTQQLRSGLNADIQQIVIPRPPKEVKLDFFDEKDSTPNKNKIIKTRGYYQQEREKRRQINERSIGSIKREQKVNYFENQMLKIENDESDLSVDSLRLDSVDSDHVREKEQLQNIKLRKKLEIFKEHLPQIMPFTQKQQDEGKLPAFSNKRIVDLAAIMRKKYEQESQLSNLSQIKQQNSNNQIITVRQQDILLVNQKSEQSLHEISNMEEQLANIMQTHRQWKPSISKEFQNRSWITKLSSALKENDQEMNNLLFQELILQALIEISQSQALIGYIKEMYEKSKKKSNKPEGIITSLISIKQYLNYFINYLYQYQMQHKIQRNLLKPIGPTPSDVLKYFRGEDLPYDPDSEYVMSIKTFNQHWQMANEMIYFDPKCSDPVKQQQRVVYLKQLTKVFFRAIFDSFNESLQYQRVYGMRGKPYPWSRQSLKKQVPNLKKAVSDSYQRVIKVSSVFCGVHFADKQHSLDPKTMQEIQEENLVKLIIMEIKEEEQLWNFYQDELVETKLELTNFIEQYLIMEVLKFIIKQRLSK